MPQGEKSKYTEKQKRKAEHIEQGYEQRGVPKDEAEARAWATVNKQDGGGKKPGGSARRAREHWSGCRAPVSPSPPVNQATPFDRRGATVLNHHNPLAF